MNKGNLEVPVCPCCGQSYPGDVLPSPSMVSGGHRRTVLRSLSEAYPNAVPRNKLLWEMYGGDDEPDGALNVLKVILHKLRKEIEPMGWTVPQMTGSYDAEYRITRFTPRSGEH